MFLFFCVCFFKQKTAYEMRISDWSSDVCSSDLLDAGVRQQGGEPGQAHDIVAAQQFDHRSTPVLGPSAPRPSRLPAMPAGLTGKTGRSEERRVGKECVSTCSSRWSPYQ